MPAIGPLPPVYEPIWYAEKVVAVMSVALAPLAALAGMTPGAGRYARPAPVHRRP